MSAQNIITLKFTQQPVCIEGHGKLLIFDKIHNLAEQRNFVENFGGEKMEVEVLTSLSFEEIGNPFRKKKTQPGDDYFVAIG